MSTSAFSFDLILLKLNPCPVRQLIREHSQEKSLGDGTSECLVEVGLDWMVSVAQDLIRRSESYYRGGSCRLPSHMRPQLSGRME